MTPTGFCASTWARGWMGEDDGLLPKIEWSGKMLCGQWRVKRCYWKTAPPPPCVKAADQR
jgi:hypothetical protein